MKFVPIFAFTVSAFFAVSAWAAGSDPEPEKASPANQAIGQIQAAIAKKDWPQARELARSNVEKTPDNADFHNLYAYSLRMGANPSLDLVFRHYNEALRLDPKHRGAHEYLGEAYLMVGNLAKAKEHLRALDDLCTFSCKEYSMLKDSIAAFEAKRARK